MSTAASRKNLVIAMALAAAALLALNRWAVPLLFELRPLRDGAGSYSSDDSRLRTAVWEAPRPLQGALDTEARESHPRLSPDGRWLAFSAGEPGRGTELFVAEVVGGVPQAPRALWELNSGADDVAPAWTSDALYFASDRAGGAGGFDLYRAGWDGASFGPSFGAVEPLAGVNSAANETEPAPSAGALYFASDRGGAGYDLFVERAAAEGARVERVDVLASEFDERDPFVTPDGRALYFSSNRRLGGADYDLHRSFRDAGAWLAPERLAGLDSAAAERAPATSADGLTLYFVRDGDASAELQVSRSIELFRGAAPARGWADLALMAALLLLAAVAALSKRWEGLDLLYKCALASAIAHLLILALLRYLYPDAELWDAPRESGPRIRVRLEAPVERTRGLVEHGGELAPQRESRDETPGPERVDLTPVELAEVALPAPSALERAETAPEAAPEPREVVVERERPTSLASAPDLASLSESRELRRAEPIASAAPIPSAAPAERVQRAHAGPVAVEIAPAPTSDFAPTAASLAKRANERAPNEAAGVFTAAPVERSSASEDASGGPAVALPSEARPRLETGSSPAPELEARAFDAGREVVSGEASGAGPQRAQVALGVEAEATEAAPNAGVLTRRRAPSPTASDEFTPAAGERADAPDVLREGPALALPSEQRARLAAQDLVAVAEGVPAPVAIAPQRRAEPSSSSGPSDRLAPTPSRVSAVEGAAPASKPLVAAPRASAADAPQAPRRLDDTPYRSRFGAEKETALREFGGTEETERAVANGLRYLAARQRRDGSWGSPNDFGAKYRDVRVGKSALALLAFLGAGHTPGAETEHARVADLAVRWLLATQDSATGHFGDCEAYGHGIATYALAECFALTRDARLGEAVRRGVQRILEEQIVRGDPRSLGGWSYFYPDGAVFDRWPRASITAWQVMALESARLGGIEVPDAAFARAADFLRGTWDPGLGRFRYSHDPQRLRSGYATLPGSTPAALFALSLLGEDLSSPRWKDAVDFVGACAPDAYRWEGERAFVERASGNLYFWYYGSLALLRRGGPLWERWNVALKEALPPAQERDGSWPPLDVYGEYAGDDDRDRVYSTAMCVLSLEVYYRYFTPLLKVR